MIASLPLPVFVVMLLFLFAMAGVAIYAGVQGRRRAALVANTPTTPIGSATAGYREFEGRIEAGPGAPLKAGLTGWPCCWFHARIEKFVGSGTSNNREAGWQTVRDWTSDRPFLVRDETGVCLVDPDGAEVTPTDKSMWYGATEKPEDRNPAKVGPTESAKGMMEVAGTPNTKYRYSEERVYAGDPLLVLGEFTAATEGRQSRSGTIGRGSGAQPFLFTTTSQADHIALSNVGGTAAIGIAALPLGRAALLVWLRFG